MANGTTVVWVRLEFVGPDAELNAAAAVDRELDTGAMQKAINGQEDDLDLRLTSATIDLETPKLISALERAVEMFRCDRSAVDPRDWHAAIRGMDEAIAKARGE